MRLKEEGRLYGNEYGRRVMEEEAREYGSKSSISNGRSKSIWKKEENNEEGRK
jgi:hypothetical protein